jgi:hypothetical protein
MTVTVITSSLRPPRSRALWSSFAPSRPSSHEYYEVSRLHFLSESHRPQSSNVSPTG